MTTVNFKELAEKAESGQSNESMNALWEAVFTLKEWHFIARGREEKPTPYVGIVDGNPFLMAFTSANGAQSFHDKNKLDDGRSHGILSIQTHNLDYIKSFYEQGVYGILFNDHEKGFYVPLANLQSLHDRIRKQDAPSAPEVAAGATGDTNTSQLETELQKQDAEVSASQDDADGKIDSDLSQAETNSQEQEPAVSIPQNDVDSRIAPDSSLVKKVNSNESDDTLDRSSSESSAPQTVRVEERNCNTANTDTTKKRVASILSSIKDASSEDECLNAGKAESAKPNNQSTKQAESNTPSQETVESSKNRQTTELKDHDTYVWTDEKASFDSFLALDENSIYIASPEKSRIVEIAEQIRSGTSPVSALQGSRAKQIQLDTLKHIKSNKHTCIINYKFTGTGGKNKLGNFTFKEELRDDLFAKLDFLCSRGFKYTETQFNRFRAAIAPLAMICAVSILSLICQQIAIQIAEEGPIEITGRYRGYKRLFVSTIEFLGPTGIIIIGGIFGILCLVWLVMRIKTPPFMLEYRNTV